MLLSHEKEELAYLRYQLNLARLADDSPRARTQQLSGTRGFFEGPFAACHTSGAEQKQNEGQQLGTLGDSEMDDVVM